MSIIETRRDQMFPVLDAAQIETAKRFASGPARAFAPGEVVFDVGERNAPAWLVLEGSIDVVRRDGLKREAPITTHMARAILRRGQPARRARTLACGRAGADGCTALPFDAAHLRALMIGSAELGEIVMRAFILRRVGLIDDGGAGAVLVGRPGTPELTRLQGFLTPQRLSRTLCSTPPTTRRAAPLVERLGVPPDELPLDDLPQRHRAAATERCRGRRLPRHHARARSRDDLRRGRRRRRARRARGRGLRRARRVCRCSCSISALSAARPALRRGSRIISAFPPASPAWRWPAAPSIRR